MVGSFAMLYSAITQQGLVAEVFSAPTANAGSFGRSFGGGRLGLHGQEVHFGEGEGVMRPSGMQGLGLFSVQ